MSISLLTRVTVTSVIVVLGCLVVAAAATAQSSLVFASNYDARLEVGDSLGHITSQAKSRDGSTFPIEYQRHRIDVTIVEGGDRDFGITLNIFEQTKGEWYQINSGHLSFEGAYSIPVTYKWSVGDVSLDLAIAVSIIRQ